MEIATDRFHLLDDALELAIGTAGSDALRLGGGAAGGPVLDASPGAVVEDPPKKPETSATSTISSWFGKKGQ